MGEETQTGEIDRNAHCPCGSKKKYRKCCGKGKHSLSPAQKDAVDKAMIECTEELRAIWIRGYKEIIQGKDHLPLETHIDVFADSVRDNVGKRYPFTDVHPHAIIVDQILRHVGADAPFLVIGQLAWHGHIELAGDNAVAAGFHVLLRVPQGRAVRPLPRRTPRQHDSQSQDAQLVPVVVNLALAALFPPAIVAALVDYGATGTVSRCLGCPARPVPEPPPVACVLYLAARTVGSRAGRAAAFAPRYGLEIDMADSHVKHPRPVRVALITTAWRGLFLCSGDRPPKGNSRPCYFPSWGVPAGHPFPRSGNNRGEHCSGVAATTRPCLFFLPCLPVGRADRTPAFTSLLPSGPSRPRQVTEGSRLLTVACFLTHG